ncbi:3-isopropylmalate dehydratase small subunit [Glaciimonas sp. PCH181]|uniref:3-isopropylmalate dehydratase small subunit n=1 Tax=Glaciimonas sp. PCH181 TaxID=2133943 RepID=UPI000D347A61|nr:3-isopropylmalate dehydratase small subunit [Glaciimonas sp. PCH181]PUA19695.1 3-isopropylmalate dehydratase small subunit [Glaciimonas sp. PCH181]
MKPFTQFTALVVPLDRANVDTDAILPKQFMKSIEKTGFGPNLFDEWRYLDPGQPGDDCSLRRKNPAFSFNDARYQGAEVLLTRENFGCGSSREHAPWALLDFGIRALIAPSFADIFYNNCFKNGILPIIMPDSVVSALLNAVAVSPGYCIKVDLKQQTLTTPERDVLNFQINEFRKRCLIEGLDDIDLTFKDIEKIRGYESVRRKQEPWLFPY